MPNIQAVTFDCAETLISVGWAPGPFALDCAKNIGLELDQQIAQETYERLLGTRWGEYRQLNQTRDTAKCRDWWMRLTRDWLSHLGLDVAHTPQLTEAADTMLYSVPNRYFRVFEDVTECLQALKDRGIRMAVVSNWDISLFRVLDAFRLSPFFEIVSASLVEGSEKPDPHIFEVTLQRLGLEPHQVLHVGDNPVDDVAGARQVGCHALLIDRDNPSSAEHHITSLCQIIDHIFESPSLA